MPLRRVRKPFFGPIKLPSELLHEIDPVFRDRDGRKLRRWRFGDHVSGPIVEEIPNEEANQNEASVPEPMSIPSSSVFGVPYTYGRSDFPMAMHGTSADPESTEPPQTVKSSWMPTFSLKGTPKRATFPVGLLFLVVVVSLLLGILLGSK